MMSANVLETQRRIVAEQMDAVSQEMKGLFAESLQPIVSQCLSLGYTWRGIISRITQLNEQFNYRAEKDNLLVLADQGSVIFEWILQKVNESPSAVDRNSKADLEILCHELKHSVKWLETWPQESAGIRDESRKRNADGKFLSEEDLVEMFQ